MASRLPSRTDILDLLGAQSEPLHAREIASRLRVSEVDYLALQRLEDSELISAEWGVSENNRKARFYTMTTKGREQLLAKTTQWNRLARAMALVLTGNAEEA